MGANFPVWLFPILEHARFGEVEEEEEQEEQKYINYYRCPKDGTKWSDVWSCCCNDMCPKCETKDIQPYRSVEIVDANKVKRKPTRKRKKKSGRSR